MNADNGALMRDLERTAWDAIVVGTGVGGATLGHALAQAGWRVLFCERGRSHLGSAASVAGEYPEERIAGHWLDARFAELLLAAGRDAGEVIDIRGSREHRFTPYVGSGTGGSSALYGMALERFFPADFAPRAQHRDAGGSTLPEAWPIGYKALSSYYARAEALYRVRGGIDPLRPSPDAVRVMAEPPPLTPAGAWMVGFLRDKGLHPYRLPLACEFVPGCRCCQGFLCDRGCKNDSARVCLAPALHEHGAALLDRCEVVHLEADATHVTGVVCRRGDSTLRLRPRIVVLAAGALRTPQLLLRSACADWPQGLANRSGLVGRNVMRHCIDLYVVQPPRAAIGTGFENRFKEFAFNDFYAVDGAKLGSVQSFGRLPPADMLFASLRHDVLAGALPWAAALLPLARPFLASTLHSMVEGSLTLATIMEDLPYADNRVLPPDDSTAVRLQYRLGPRERRRIAQFRRLVGDALSPLRWRLVRQAQNNERLAHVCGTCRFGEDPASSVLDGDNRAHGLDNLYVVDSSFFPSSGGTNPSLTIAANALRVADHLATRGLAT